jgi:hypothetical protein
MAEVRVSRATLLRGGIALAAGGAALAAWPLTTRSAPSAAQDQAILRFALTLEDLQPAFYADALQQGALKGRAARVRAGRRRAREGPRRPRAPGARRRRAGAAELHLRQ